MTATTFTERRELAHRSSDGIEVTLFWTKPSNRVTVAVVDSRSSKVLEFDVDGSSAVDAFNHPYAYAAARPSAQRHHDTRAGTRADARNGSGATILRPRS